MSLKAGSARTGPEERKTGTKNARQDNYFCKTQRKMEEEVGFFSKQGIREFQATFEVQISSEDEGWELNWI